MDIVDREFEQLSPSPTQSPATDSPSSRIKNRFAVMVALSFVLHVVTASILLSPRSASQSAPPVAFIDLKDMNLPEEAPVVPTAPAVPQQPPEPVENIPDPPPVDPPQPLSEMEKLQTEVTHSLQNAQTDPEVLQESSFGLGLTNGYFTSIGQGETLRGDIREYYFAMLRQINEKWWLTREAQQEELREVVINIVVARDGTVLEKVVISGSGNRILDRAMLATIEAASPLPPLPATFNMDIFSAPLRFMKPLNLFQSLAR